MANVFVDTMKREFNYDGGANMAAIMGRWPGDETDEEVEAALEQIS